MRIVGEIAAKHPSVKVHYVTRLPTLVDGLSYPSPPLLSLPPCVFILLLREDQNAQVERRLRALGVSVYLGSEGRFGAALMRGARPSFIVSNGVEFNDRISFDKALVLDPSPRLEYAKEFLVERDAVTYSGHVRVNASFQVVDSKEDVVAHLWALGDLAQMVRTPVYPKETLVHAHAAQAMARIIIAVLKGKDAYSTVRT